MGGDAQRDFALAGRLAADGPRANELDAAGPDSGRAGAAHRVEQGLQPFGHEPRLINAAGPRKNTLPCDDRRQ